ncbi:Dystrotelin [Oryzias melastigma]|uniref:Dystrotelin n=1 Tax=Oryzias melastigma TaxID=30732 RepID=A0A834FMW1_ORYME|nr:Dystrotelin [Oryzias melastigma]
MTVSMLVADLSPEEEKPQCLNLKTVTDPNCLSESALLDLQVRGRKLWSGPVGFMEVGSKYSCYGVMQVIPDSCLSGVSGTLSSMICLLMISLLLKTDSVLSVWFSDVHDVHVHVYQTAVKLLSLQRCCYMDRVLVQHVVAALDSVGGATHQQEVMMDGEEVMHFLNSMFDHASKDIPEEAPEEISCLMFRLFDRLGTGQVSVRSLQTALVALSADFLLPKYQSLVSISAGGSGSVSQSGLRSLLQDLNQVPLAVQGGEAYGGVEVAVKACFNGVLTPTASEEHVLTWLQSEPPPLLWLPALFRLTASQKVRHPVRCHSCKTAPIIGHRYRCMRCINVHVCQSCFLTDQCRGKHKAHHPVQEFCSQVRTKHTR